MDRTNLRILVAYVVIGAVLLGVSFAIAFEPAALAVRGFALLFLGVAFVMIVYWRVREHVRPSDRPERRL